MQLEQQETFEIKGPQLEVFGEVETKLPAPAKKRPVAAAVLAAAILVSVFGIGGAKLAARHERVAAIFHQTDYTTEAAAYGVGIQTDFDAQVDAAANLARLCAGFMGEDDPAVAAVSDAVALWNAGFEAYGCDAGVQYELNSRLRAAVEGLYPAALAAAGEKASQVEMLYAEFTSRQDLINREAATNYNPAAQEYNQLAAGFPASLQAALWDAGPLPLFAPGQASAELLPNS